MDVLVSWTIKDAKGQKSVMSWRVGGDDISNDDNTGILEWAQEVAVMLDPFIAGAIVKIKLDFDVPLPAGIKTVPALNADNEEGVLLTFRTSTKFPVLMRWPTFNENEYIGNDKYVLDRGDPQMDALISMFDSLEMLVWQVESIDARGDQVGLLAKAVDDFRRRKRLNS